MSKKIPLSTEQKPLQSPFAAFEMQGLPAGPDIPEPPAQTKPSKRAHRLVLRREKSNRGGKTVVVVSQLPTHLSPPEIENLCRDARKSLGCGGTVQGREIEIQGDQPERVRNFFEKLGYVLVGP